MLEIQEFDKSRPVDARTPDKRCTNQRGGRRDTGRMLGGSIGGLGYIPSVVPIMTPIDTPLVLSGFSAADHRRVSPMFRQMGITAVQGGAGARTLTAKPVPGWQHSLNPGEAVAGVLVSGDMSATGMGTVTYNDGKTIFAFGHPFFDLGPLDMPMAKSEILMVLSSAFQPTKFGNATGVVGALRQDRLQRHYGRAGRGGSFHSGSPEASVR